MRTLAKRYIRGLGWLAERGGEPASLRKGEAVAVLVTARVVGTREAASILGVRPPNFVRDWASRSDFPRPISALASGRVWSEAEVRAFRDRAARPSDERLAAIARRVVWWQGPEQTLSRPSYFIAHGLAKGSLEDVQDLERAFGRDGLRRAIAEAPAGVFDPRGWRFWLIVLGMSRDLPLPVRRTT